MITAVFAAGFHYKIVIIGCSGRVSYLAANADLVSS